MYWIGGGNSVSRFAAQAQLVALKEIYPWLDEVNSQSLQYVVKQCADSFKNWWEHRAEHPVPKRKDSKQSFHNPQRCSVDWKHRTISIPKCKEIKAVLHRPFYGTIKDITISKCSGDRYYASVLVDTAIREKECDAVVDEKTSIGIGIDLNCGDIVCSDGHCYTSPKALRHAEHRLRLQQRRLSRKQIGSNNRAKQKHIVSKCHAKVRDKRHDFLHKVTHDLTHDNQVRTIFIEDLNVRGMKRNHHLAKSVSDAAFGEFIRQLTYKGQWYGVNVVKIDRWAPSSKTCSACGWVYRGLKLSQRDWTCVCCGTHHDRDYNASVNIKSFGLMALPPNKREVKPVDRPTVDDRRSMNGLRSNDGKRPSGKKQEKIRGVTDALRL